MTRFIWKNGTELDPIPLTASQAHKLAQIICNTSISKEIEGVVCYLDSIPVDDNIAIQQYLKVVKRYEDETRSVQISDTYPNSGFIITSDEAELGDFITPTGITEKYGQITVTSGYTPSTNKLDFIQFRLGFGRNFPMGAIPMNLTQVGAAATAITNFTNDPVAGHKFIEYPELNSIFLNHNDLFDFIYKMHHEDLIKFFTDTKSVVVETYSSEAFTDLAAYVKLYPDSVKYLNEQPHYCNSMINTGWYNWVINNGQAYVNSNVPIDVSQYDMQTMFAGNSNNASQVTELIDCGKPWEIKSYGTNDLIKNYFSNSTKLKFNCSKNTLTDLVYNYPKVTELSFPNLEYTTYSGRSYTDYGQIYNVSCTKLSFPNLKYAGCSGYGSFLSDCSNLIELNLPNLETWLGQWSGGIVVRCNSLEKLYLPKLQRAGGGGGGRDNFIYSCANLKKLVINKGIFDDTTNVFSSIPPMLKDCPCLVQIRFLNETVTSQYLKVFNPTTALSTTDTTLLTEELLEDLRIEVEDVMHHEMPTISVNRDLFLANFRYFIANRLADKTGATQLTLTLSSAVYTAINTDTTLYPNKKGGNDITTWNYLTATDGTGINWKIVKG